MKNSKLVKIVLVIILGIALVITSKNVFAVSLDPNGLSGTTTGGTTTGGTTTSKPTTGNSTNNNNAVLKTNNTSNYNNSSLPKTGVEDSMPIIVLTVVFGISAIYAYKKIQDYKNI